MDKRYLSLLFVSALVMVTAIVDADMVILKSGEMFQTQRAWKENGAVKYYKNGRVVRVDESEVERLIHSPAPVEDKPPSEDRPAADPPSPPDGPTVGQPFPPPLPADNDTGYLDLKWGRPPSQFEGLTLVGTDPAYGGVQQYTKKQRKKRFGRASVDDIVYGFWQGGLYTITVWTSNFLDFRDLKAEAFRRFSQGLRNREDVEKYYWMDKGADRMLSYDYYSDTGFLWMRSRALDIQVKARYPE
ncbi:MAG: hypothetical protein HGJ94_19240 [Desulfosarcina sp.]|nr:hypothetical protein [Desulfosarcina sp.]MBC2742324.1 hypothetical protein [Desulfosarcina sp.]MBC2765235.1 hypothetical protein [Desulfosarcina sp.]